MSKIHALEATGRHTIRVALHFNVMIGNNAAGVPWKDVLVAAGKIGTILADGGVTPGPGSTTTVERTSLLAGDILELVTVLEVDPALSGAALSASVNAQADSLINEYKTKLQREYQQYGRAIGTVI